MTTPYTGVIVPANNWVIVPPVNAYVDDAGQINIDLSGEPGGPVAATTLSASGAVTFDSTLAVAGATTSHATTLTTGNLTVSTGSIAATVGAISAGTTVTAGTGVVATTGGVTASAGNIVATLGNISTGAGSITAATTVTAGTGLTVSSGAVTTTGATQVGLTEALTFQIADLAAAGTYWVVSPWSGTIIAAYAIVNGITTTGSAILTGNIAATPITGGVITVTVGSAAGDIFSASPSAANTVVAGVSKINFVRSGANDAVVSATVTLLIRRSA